MGNPEETGAPMDPVHPHHEEPSHHEGDGAEATSSAPQQDPQEQQKADPAFTDTDSAHTDATPDDDSDNAGVADTSEAETSDNQTKEPLVADLKAQVAQLDDDLAHVRADYYNLKNEYSSYVRRQKSEGQRQREAGHREVVEALVSVLDDIAAARAHEELSGPFAAIVTKLETSLDKGFGVARYGEAGEAFDPAVHDALMAEESSEVTEARIAQVLQPGYRMGEYILRPAKVMVHNPA